MPLVIIRFCNASSLVVISFLTMPVVSLVVMNHFINNRLSA